jgi:hypothetical protein
LNFGEFFFRNGLENRNGFRIGAPTAGERGLRGLDRPPFGAKNTRSRSLRLFIQTVSLRTRVNKECEGLRCIPLDDQGEAVTEAEVVAVVAGTVCSGAATVFSIVFSGAGTVFSTITVRAGGAGGAASSRLPLIRPRRNPKSNPTASTTSTSRTNLASPAFLLSGLTLLLPILLSLHSSCRTHTCCSAP